MTLSQGDIAIYLLIGLVFFTLLTAFVFALFNDKRGDEEEPSEFTAHWREPKRNRNVD